LRIAVVILALFTVCSAFAQEKSRPWIFGIGFHAIDDSGTRFREPLNFRDHYNYVLYPSILHIEKHTGKSVSFQAIGSYSKSIPGKIINGRENNYVKNYFSGDLLFKLNLNYFFKNKPWFDSYLLYGGGYSYRWGHRPDIGPGMRQGFFFKETFLTHNLGFGFNIWFRGDLGLNFQSIGKLSTEDSSNHIQHAVSLIYRFDQTSSRMRKKYDLDLKKGKKKKKDEVKYSLPSETEEEEE
jgi:OmpA-OmpF porin, OOP family